MKFPRDAWTTAGIDPVSLPDEEEIPDRVPGLYTVQTPGNVSIFDTIALTAEGTDLHLRLIVVGAVDQTPNLLYVLDPDTGQVLQFDPGSVNVRGVNSTYRWFIESLKRVSHAMESAGTHDLAPVLTMGLKFTLRAVDDTAFEAGAWWPLVFERLAD